MTYYLTLTGSRGFFDPKRIWLYLSPKFPVKAVSLVINFYNAWLCCLSGEYKQFQLLSLQQLVFFSAIRLNILFQNFCTEHLSAYILNYDAIISPLLKYYMINLSFLQDGNKKYLFMWIIVPAFLFF